jgi:hypothetical protein
MVIRLGSHVVQVMTALDDDVLHTIAACGSPAEVAALIRDRVTACPTASA